MANWIIREALSKDLEEALADYSDLEKIVLCRQGVKSREEAEKYLQPDYERDLFDPFRLTDMAKAVARIERAVKEGESIVIFGDYDADGVPGAAVLGDFFKLINYANVEVYLPDRHNEKYGLSEEALQKFSARGAKLVITVDCGITNINEIETAKRLGLDVVITDHHLTPPNLPAALAVIDPKREDDNYPEKNLAGAGVAFKLVQALASRFGLAQKIKWFLDLVAIATVADMVPLTGENRTLVHFGLKVLRQTRRVGLQTFFRLNRLRIDRLTEDDIAYIVGPRINTASRLSHASQAYVLLTTDSRSEAKIITRHLEEKNLDRRQAVEEILRQVDDRLFDSRLSLIVAGAEHWSPGVLGLSATRLVEKYRRPVFLWAENGQGEIRGSCRSDGTINIVDLMRQAGGGDYFLDYGGHQFAGGFSLPAGREEELEERLSSALAAMSRSHLDNYLVADQTLTLDEVNEGLYKQIERMGPYGTDNPKPVFWFKNIVVKTVKAFGNGGAHLELSFSTSRGPLKAVGFFDYEDYAHLTAGQMIDLLANVEKSHFRGRSEVRLRIVDINSSASKYNRD